jgi:hypothetical protein
MAQAGMRLSGTEGAGGGRRRDRGVRPVRVKPRLSATAAQFGGEVSGFT